MRRGGRDLHTLAGAYAMDAVPAPERARFERHLARCDSCRQEIQGLREATAALGAAVSVEPPAAAKETALRAAAHTRQLPPAVLAPPAGWAAARGRSRLGRSPRLAVAALACALAALGVVAGVAGYGLQHRLDQAAGRDHAVAAVLTAPDATMLSSRVRTGGTATIVMSHRERALVFTAADLRLLPAAENYELWLIGPAGTRGAGMLASSGHGKMSGPVVVSGLSAGDSVGLTVEPASGSPQPTSPPVVMISLAGR